ncbi:MAG: methyltransferase domain-containing protein [Candidatus Altiarchaeota archaeon]|nr:methyltransferase domain-containing protein [Candidatus Altiarchaeota archaeon]
MKTVRDKHPKDRHIQRKRLSLSKCLGPVSSLEGHVHPEWWNSIFNSLYLKTDADVVDDQSITAQEITVYSDILKLAPEERVLDLCCGQGRHSLELARRSPGHVEGIDRSHYLIERAKATARREGLSVRFREGDARKLPFPPDSFDVVVILGNSFGYFETVNDDMRVLREVHRVLKPWGRLLIDVADGNYLKENFQQRSWEWMDKRYFVCRERSLSADESRLISREVITNSEKGVVADQFYAERLYSRESLTSILKKAQYSDVTFHMEVATESRRNQDLGMMERRLIATAAVRKPWTPAKRKRREGLKNVAVILGDPHRPDPLKPSSIFDDDDFYTIDRLKEALRELPGYDFTYLDDHTTLISDLLRNKGKMDYVFNLCDEGYRNDPRKELHVPAILEMLGMPYTGSGPQCLAHCYDKSLVRGISGEMGIPVPKGVFIKPEDSSFDLPIDFPVLTKPNFGDSSFGITQRSVVNDLEELIGAISGIREKFGYDKPLLVEEFLTGKDLTVGMIGNPPDSYKVLPILEEDYSMLPPELPKICGYEAKWLPDSPYWKIKSIPAQLPEETRNVMVECCLKLYERLECRDYVRFDWRLNSRGEPRLLEVNPNPGWCWDGHLAKMSRHAQIDYGEMLKLILESAEKRLKVYEETV